ncbi:acyl-CoA synthetase [Streptomyces sp. NA02950]|uniref:AMP-binding protein n=1 Tax=Streptomyces sp. NA02950 TaxID=2742137 RepID=UPI00159252C3|nr:AMP-binding protein [Streptomyces sp. NA02950]QKV90925.1 acyl-CoA synthetase [Streptomyces sp. NA02950]
MWQRLLPERGFYPGLMFQEAAARHGRVRVTLDRPLDIAPEAGDDFAYPELADLIDDMAGRLWSAGVRPSEHVAILKRDNADVVLLTCAVSRIGAVPALLSPTLEGGVVAVLLDRLHAPWLITDREALMSTLSGVDTTLARGVLTVDEAPGKTLALAGLAGVPRRPAIRLHPHEPSLITHGPGAAGIPRLEVHSPHTLWNRLVPQQALGRATRGEPAALHLPFASSRIHQLLGVLLHFGSPLLLLTDPDPAQAGPLLTTHRPGIVETDPHTFALWEELADAPGGPLSRVRSYGSPFDTLHPRTVKRLLDASRRRDPRLMQLYGQGETGPIAFGWYTRRGLERAHERRVGTGIPGFTRIRVVDERGRTCPPGAPGAVEVRTRGRILTYLGAPEQYARQVDHGWWRMGDTGYRDWWGALYLLDPGADRVSPAEGDLEVEDELLSRLAELREVIIVRGPGREAMPVVCTRGDRPLDTGRWLRATGDLPSLAAPVQCRFEDLPRTRTWKIKRLEIARLLATGELPVLSGASAHG